jgi:hypothetical protein
MIVEIHIAIHKVVKDQIILLMSVGIVKGHHVSWGRNRCASRFTKATVVLSPIPNLLWALIRTFTAM